MKSSKTSTGVRLELEHQFLELTTDQSYKIYKQSGGKAKYSFIECMIISIILITASSVASHLFHFI